MMMQVGEHITLCGCELDIRDPMIQQLIKVIADHFNQPA